MTCAKQDATKAILAIFTIPTDPLFNVLTRRSPCPDASATNGIRTDTISQNLITALFAEVGYNGAVSSG